MKENEIPSQIINTNTADLYQLNSITYDLYIPPEKLTLSRKLLREFVGEDVLEEDNKGLKPKSILLFLGIVILVGILVAFANEKLGIIDTRHPNNNIHIPSY